MGCKILLFSFDAQCLGFILKRKHRQKKREVTKYFFKNLYIQFSTARALTAFDRMFFTVRRYLIKVHSSNTYLIYCF